MAHPEAHQIANRLLTMLAQRDYLHDTDPWVVRHLLPVAAAVPDDYDLTPHQEEIFVDGDEDDQLELAHRLGLTALHTALDTAFHDLG